MYYMRNIQNRVYYCKFRHTQAYSHPIQTYSAILWHILNCVFIQNPAIVIESWHFQNLRYIQNTVKAYFGIFRKLCNSPIFRTLSYSELCHIQNFGHEDPILGPMAYSESCLFRHMTYSSIFNNDSYKINFLFFTLILHMFFDYNDVNFNARPSLLK